MVRQLHEFSERQLEYPTRGGPFYGYVDTGLDTLRYVEMAKYFREHPNADAIRSGQWNFDHQLREN